MNLDYAKNKIKEKLGIPLKFIYKGARNQVEEFEGTIVKCFPSVFIVETTDNVIKSFTYNDFIIKSIRIIS